MDNISDQRGQMAEKIVNHSNFVIIRFNNSQTWSVSYISKNISLFGYTNLQFYDGLIEWKDIIHSNDYNRLNFEYQDAVLNKKTSLSRIYRIVKESGEAVWVRDFIYIKRNEFNEVLNVEAIVVDITEEKRENQEKFILEKIVNDSEMIIALFGKNEDGYSINYISDNINIYGYLSEEFMSGKKAWIDIIHPEDLDYVKEEARYLTVNNIDKYTQEYRIVAKNGKSYWIKDTTTTIRDSQNNKLYVECFFTNITEFKKLEIKLRESNEALQEKLKYIMNPTNFEGIQYSLADFLDIKQLEEIQSAFTSLNSIYAVIVDENNKPKTHVTGPIDRIGEFYDITELKEFTLSCEIFKNSKIENGMPDMRIMNFKKVKISGVPISIGDRVIATWIICAYEEYDVRNFIQVARALYVLVNSLTAFSYKNAVISLDYKKSKNIQLKTQEMLVESRFYTDILSLLQESGEGVDTIIRILDKIGRYLKVSRIIISEYNKKTERLLDVCDWTKEGFENKMAKMDRISEDTVRYLRSRVLQDHVIIVDGNKIPSELTKLFYMFNAKALVTVEVIKDNKFSYLVSYVEGKTERVWDEGSIAICEDMGKVIADALIKKNAVDMIEKTKNTYEIVLDNVDSYIFVQDIENLNLLYINKKLKELYSGKNSRFNCWEFLHGEDEPCKNCLLRTQKKVLSCQNELFIEELGRRFILKSEPIVWIDGSEARIVTMYDAERQ